MNFNKNTDLKEVWRLEFTRIHFLAADSALATNYAHVQRFIQANAKELEKHPDLNINLAQTDAFLRQAMKASQTAKDCFRKAELELKKVLP